MRKDIKANPNFVPILNCLIQIAKSLKQPYNKTLTACDKPYNESLLAWDEAVHQIDPRGGILNNSQQKADAENLWLKGVRDWDGIPCTRRLIPGNGN